ncbi:DUF3139 domain-containing protein [Staphylococcus argensis]|uniref:DUF3139 domain-containing protein n=1 Tax=Staphylococcus argensis TaxID=1607738 RepID=A0A2K4FAX0_9STAP|nr:DUF3139 domain-containing protein [Staphylococcus argensis]MCY6991698.1 DUF3139 domain-containing protein [Staphylococcus argensis]POA08502.1 hypothetical protein CD039_10535 [Staphylococcus argensis]
MKKIAFALGIILFVVLGVVCYFWRFRHISYKEINLELQHHHFQKHIKSEENRYDEKQYGYYKEIIYKDEPHNVYLYQTVERPNLTEFINPFYHYKKHNVMTEVHDTKTENEISGERTTNYQIENQ